MNDERKVLIDETWGRHRMDALRNTGMLDRWHVNVLPPPPLPVTFDPDEAVPDTVQAEVLIFEIERFRVSPVKTRGDQLLLVVTCDGHIVERTWR